MRPGPNAGSARTFPSARTAGQPGCYLDRKTAQQERKIAGFAPCFGHQSVLQRSDALDAPHPESANRRGGPALYAVKAGKPVGGRRDHQCVEAPPPFVAGEELGIAKVE